jgi:uncharacterized membrane protein
LLRYFLVGVVAVLPLVITGGVVIWVAGMINRLLGPQAVMGRMLANLGLRFVSHPSVAYLSGWLIVLGVIFGLGVLLEVGARRVLQDRVDTLVSRIPILGGVYGTARQLVGMMDKKGHADYEGMSVVFCVFGEQTGAAFLALMPTPERFRIGELDYHAILVPTAPLPFGGSLMFVPVGAVRPAQMPVDAFMSIYVSMGVTGPQFMPPVRVPPTART